MRTIKFRAWDKFNGCYYYSDKYKSLSAFFKECEKCIEADNGIVYQQFTGLKDKNGKDVFEGDVVEQSDDRYVVESCSGGYQLIVYQQTKCKCYWYKTGSLFNSHALSENFCEIIGNIFENKNLLNN